MSGRRIVTRFRELEVEAVDAPDGMLEEVADRLHRAGAGPAETRSKVVRALAEDARPELQVRPTGPNSTGAEVVSEVLATSVRRLILSDPVVRAGEDPEGVHQARVALRRLRSDVGTLAPLLRGDRSEPLRARVKRLARTFGAARDADVLLDRLRSLSSDLGEEEKAEAGRLLGSLERHREQARARLLTVLRSTDYDEVLGDLISMAARPPVTAAAEGAAREALPPLLKQRWKSLRKAVARGGSAPSDEDLHRIRIRAKRFRYASEAATPVLGKAAKKAAKSAERLQDVLGEVQDGVMSREWLEGASAGVNGRQGFVAGLLAARLDRTGQAARDSWKTSWESLARRVSALWS
jgi:CHAD domain-containing protein